MTSRKDGERILDALSGRSSRRPRNPLVEALDEVPGPAAVKARTTLKQRGVITIPAEIRSATHLEEGDPIEVEVTDEGILLRPMKLIEATQAWFWTPEWQAKEQQADKEFAEGKGEIFASGEEFLAALEARMRKPRASRKNRH
jgi:AbrB family looped-hinge helix DNA binding protein